MFESMSDWLIVECVLPWLVARPPEALVDGTMGVRTAPRLWQIRTVVSFGGACRRLYGVVCDARTVWAAVDIGRAIEEIAGNGTSKTRAALHVPRSVLARCEVFTK
jgi:hypothetical protein